MNFGRFGQLCFVYPNWAWLPERVFVEVPEAGRYYKMTGWQWFCFAFFNTSEEVI